MKSLQGLQVFEQGSRTTDFVTWGSLLLRSQALHEAARLAEQERCSPCIQAITKAAVGAMGLVDTGAEPLVDLQITSNGFVAAGGGGRKQLLSIMPRPRPQSSFATS